MQHSGIHYLRKSCSLSPVALLDNTKSNNAFSLQSGNLKWYTQHHCLVEGEPLLFREI